MSFNTLDFLLLLAVTMGLYFVLPWRLRNPLLLASSYVFYAAYSLKLTLFLVIMTFLTYALALKISQCREAERDKKLAKRWMSAGVIICLVILAFFKYFNFLSDSLAAMIGAEGNLHLSLMVPLGISFIVFTLVSYLVDVYRGTIAAERNLLKYALFVSFFPKVAQGPIEKAGDILPQFEEKHNFDLLRFRAGMLMVLYGLFMKMVVADRAAISVDKVYGNLSAYTGTSILIATVLFSFQIYCDFAGYSYVAIGVAKVLGFNFKQNFRQPYRSLSVAEFWRRWHISLNRWLIDYLYIPLGGSRCSKLRKNYNTLITFVLSGLWHGADWGYIIWGLLNGVYIIIEAECKALLARFRLFKQDEKDSTRNDPLSVGSVCNRFLHITITYILIVFSWIFFRAQKLSVAVIVIKRIATEFNLRSFLDYARETIARGKGAELLGLDVVFGLPILIVGIMIVIIVDVLSEKRELSVLLARDGRMTRWIVSYALLFAILLFGIYGYGYNASSFIYAGF